MPSRWRSRMKGTLELGEGAHHGQQKGAHGAVFAGEAQLLFDEVDLDAFGGQLAHDAA